MNPTLTVLLLLAVAYLIGAVPFGLLAGRLRGVDIRTVGSGNIGATNAGRVLGRRWGLAVFVLDVAKGLLPTLLAGSVLRSLAAEAELSDPVRYLCWLAVGAAAVIGHSFPIYLRFRGGKGAASSLGVALGVYPELTWPALLAFAVWAAVVAISRYVSLGSICASVAFPVAFISISIYRGKNVLTELWPLLAFTVLLGALVVLRHRSNLGRLLAGTEAKIGRPASEPKPAQDR